MGENGRRPGPNLADRLRPLRRATRWVEVAQVARFGGSLLAVAFRTPVLVLHTVGRRSGRSRATTVAYHRSSGGSLVIVGGAGGQTRLPDWVANLRAKADVAVTVDRVELAVTAIEVTGPRSESLWAELVDVWPRITTYERRAGRRPPVFELISR